MSDRFDGTYRIAASGVERIVEVREGRVATRRLGLVGGAGIEVEGRELALVLDATTWRHDIPTWRWRSGGVIPSTWRGPAFDDRGWRVVPHLHPLITARSAGSSRFRAWLTLPAAVEGEPITVLVGGLDAEDWSRYATWLDGEPLGRWEGNGAIREPHRTVLEPGSAAYGRLRFGEPMLLAVETSGLTRSHPDRVSGELEHHFFADWLVDQAVVAGPVDRVVDDLRVVELRADADRELVLELRSGDDTLGATVRYAVDGEVVRKEVVVENRSGAAVMLMDAVLDAWRGPLDATHGGRGQPAVMGGMFAAVAHPAGVARVAPDRVDLVQMPGVAIAPGERLALRPTILGGAPGVPVDAAVRSHILGLRERPQERIKVYSALGWYDFTNPADPLPELTEDLVAENLEQLGELADSGARFDVYMLDDWWDWTDLGRFRRDPFPGGAAVTTAAIEAVGMRPGIWWATTRAAWSVRDRDGMERAVANAPDFGAPLDLAGGEWRWLEEFSNLMIGERRFCLAAEPYRGHALTSLPAVIGATRAALFKLDCAVLHCTSSDHGHRPGRHSYEAMADAVAELVAAARQRSPGLRVVLYWGFRSPWWLGIADAMFDKGLLMEAATVASSPSRTIRHSLTTNVDQAIRHARFVPRRLQDSLGVWIGDVAWCNRIGREEWLEAFLVDIARGADLVQLWGDLTLLDELDRRALGEVLGWFDRELAGAAEPELLGGDPWLGEAYGYRGGTGAGTLVTAVNPGPWEAAVSDGVPDGGWVERYPVPGRTTEGGAIRLRPYEARVVTRTGALGGVEADHPRSPGAARGTRRASGLPDRPLALAGDGVAVRWAGSLVLPTIGRDDEVHLSARLRKDGEWAYVPEPGAIVRIGATLDGLAVRTDRLPRTRDRNGPGSPWVLLRIPAGPSWSGRSLDVTVEAEGPAGMEVVLDAVILEAWWKRSREFAATPSGIQPTR